ncbi:MAG TPA: phosphoribosyltransferase family protein [Candidatus Deferrimicrobiaceae bacterium]|nr:phosphoribosyltransferase family protein [Candidatus Deferrimicrobiaceae bacterium]
MTAVIVGAYENAATAVAALAPAGGKRRAAVLPRAAVDDEARVRLRQAQVECLSTLDGGDLAAARRLAAALAEAEGWERVDGAPAPAGQSEPGDVIGWYEVRIGGALTTDRPVTRLHGSRRYIASFNLLGQARLNQACGDLLYRRLTDDGVALGEVFDVIVCSESKAVGMAQVVVECFGQDRYVVLRKGLKNYMPRHPRAPLVEEASSITTAGAQALVLDPLDWPLLEGRRVLLVDDVIATGGTARAACRLLERAGARVVAAATVLLKGPEPDLPRLVVLARPLL